MLQPADRYQAFQCHYGQYAPSSRNTLSIGWMCMKTDKIRKKKNKYSTNLFTRTRVDRLHKSEIAIKCNSINLNYFAE